MGERTEVTRDLDAPEAKVRRVNAQGRGEDVIERMSSLGVAIGAARPGHLDRRALRVAGEVEQRIDPAELAVGLEQVAAEVDGSSRKVAVPEQAIGDPVPPLRWKRPAEERQALGVLGETGLAAIVGQQTGAVIPECRGGASGQLRLSEASFEVGDLAQCQNELARAARSVGGSLPDRQPVHEVPTDRGMEQTILPERRLNASESRAHALHQGIERRSTSPPDRRNRALWRPTTGRRERSKRWSALRGKRSSPVITDMGGERFEAGVAVCISCS